MVKIFFVHDIQKNEKINPLKKKSKIRITLENVRYEMKRKYLDSQTLLELKRQTTKAYMAIYREHIHKSHTKNPFINSFKQLSVCGGDN